MHHSISLGLAALALAACDDEDRLTAGEFITVLADLICDKAYDCMSTFPGDSAQFAESYGASRAACAAKQDFVPAADV